MQQDQALCLTRDSPGVKSNDSVRKSRKALLTELSGLIKAAKLLPGNPEDTSCDFQDIADQIILWTFKIVLRGARFLETWEVHNEELHQSVVDEYYDDMDGGIPPTPPADSCAHSYKSSNASLHEPEGASGNHFLPQLSARDQERSSSTPAENQESELHFSSHTARGHVASPYSDHSAAAGSAASAEPRNALALLNRTHDALLTHVGSYIGRLHGQARFTPQLELAQDQLITACRDLLQVVESIYERDNYRGKALAVAKEAMHQRISSLLAASRLLISKKSAAEAEDEEEEDGGVLVPDGGHKLVLAATACVRDAGECLSKGRFVLERVGDFEIEWDSLGIGLGISTVSTDPVQANTASTGRYLEVSLEKDIDAELMPPPPTPDKIPPPPPPKEEKSLPQIPTEASEPPPPPPAHTDSSDSVATVIHSPEQIQGSAQAPPRPESAKSLLHPLPNNLTPLIIRESNAVVPTQDSQGNTISKSNRADSIGTASTTATESTVDGTTRGSEFSMTSTRATTPEPTSSTTVATPLLSTDLTALGASQISLVSSSGASTSGVSEHTHTDDLSFNKEGQITGGTLPALVEKLTVHDTTPDAIFVSTFYLTFRLFTTPKQFAETLVERYDSVITMPTIGQPVRLRVFNVFKQWLESNWRHDSDHMAIDIIRTFADTRLRGAFPQAAARLQELTEKVSEVEGPIVPRLVSGMGKGATASTTWEAPVAPPVVTRAQINILKSPTAAPSILDFDVAEIARQLTLKESRMFCSIKPEELLAQEWTKKNDKAPNVLSMSSLSTDLAHFVAETILDAEDVKRRATILKHWIKVADKCLELKNYDSMMAVMCTMNTSTVLRLKRTWEALSPRARATLEHLRSVIDISKNHAVLRAKIRDHVPPCLPFLGTYLTDVCPLFKSAVALANISQLTFIDVGNPSERPISADGSTKQLINFDKHVKTARIISELQRFQIPYRIAEVPELQKWIDAQLERVHNSKTADVQHLYRRSLMLEPREKPVTPADAPPVPPLQLKTDVFAWTHVFKTPVGNKN